MGATVGVVSEPRLSIIIPALNEGRSIAHTLLVLQPLRQAGHQVILVDGGSTDDTLEQSYPLVDRVLAAPCGRARQMQFGTLHADGNILWFLHADTVADREVVHHICQLLSSPVPRWGFFQVTFREKHFLLAVISHMMNLRSRLTGIGTGDQGIFVSRKLYEAVGGFDDIPLMEDISLCKKLRKVSRPRCLPVTLQISARRWLDKGVTRTILLMWCLRVAYFIGVKPITLSRFYSASQT
jgi:rSAM/selenodomain-associated transferase 2